MQDMLEAASAKLDMTRLLAAGAGLLVAILWSSSFALVKVILPAVGPLTIAALRYFTGFLLLLPVMAARHVALRAISRGLWLRLLLLGFLNFALGNGAIFLSLKYLPATVAGFLGSLIPLLVLLGGLAWLHEVPSRRQWIGMIVTLAGSFLFFWRGWQPVERLGLLISLVGMVSFAAAAVLSREIARQRTLNTFALAALPLGLGGGLLLPVALAVEGMPVLTPQVALVVSFLSLVNTTLGYLLYYRALRDLTALEMNVILNLMPFGTAIIARLILDERLSALQIVAMLVSLAGVTLVQIGRRAPDPEDEGM